MSITVRLRLNLRSPGHNPCDNAASGGEMTSTVHRLLISLVGLAIGWILALRALNQVGTWVALSAVAFLALIVLGLIRAARI